jgi:hypothetical protein
VILWSGKFRGIEERTEERIQGARAKERERQEKKEEIIERKNTLRFFKKMTKILHLTIPQAPDVPGHKYDVSLWNICRISCIVCANACVRLTTPFHSPFLPPSLPPASPLWSCSSSPFGHCVRLSHSYSISLALSLFVCINTRHHCHSAYTSIYNKYIYAAGEDRSDKPSMQCSCQQCSCQHSPTSPSAP